MSFVVCHTNTFSASTFKHLMLIKAQLSLGIEKEDNRRKRQAHGTCTCYNDSIILLVLIS